MEMEKEKKSKILRVITLLLASFMIISIALIIIKFQIGKIYIGYILLTIEVCYLLFFSFGKVKIDEVAALFYFGRLISNLKPGLYFAPKGIFSVRKERGTDILDELPAPPEKIFHGDGQVPDGMFLPIRVKFGPPKENDSEELRNDPYNHTMVLDVIPIINWQIKNAGIFFEVMGSVDNCRRILSAKAIEIFGDDFSTMTPAKALQHLGETSNTMEEKLTTQTENSGILIKDAYVKPFNFPHELNKAVVNVSSQRQKALSTVIEAGSLGKKRALEGKGEASYMKDTLKAKAIGEALIKKLILEAEAIGIDKLVKIAEKDGAEIIIWMKTLAGALKNAQYSIIPGGDIFKATSGIQEMLEKVKGGLK